MSWYKRAKWSNKYKRSIDCSHPKGFSQRAHCQGRKKRKKSSTQIIQTSSYKTAAMKLNVDYFVREKEETGKIFVDLYVKEEKVGRAILSRGDFAIDDYRKFQLLGDSKIANEDKNLLNEYYVIDEMWAHKGFGPRLYDICIEQATNKGKKLINAQNFAALLLNLSHDHPEVLSKRLTLPKAQIVWSKYKDREDVIKHELSTGGYALSKGDKFFYQGS